MFWLFVGIGVIVVGLVLTYLFKSWYKLIGAALVIVGLILAIFNFGKLTTFVEGILPTKSEVSSEIVDVDTAEEAAAEAPAVSVDGPLFGTTMATPDTDVELAAAFGFAEMGIKPVATFVTWDPNKWNWQSNSVGFKGITLKIPYGYSANVTASTDETPRVYISLEEGKTVDVQNVIGFTIRKLVTYPIDNPWRISATKHFNQEWDYGMNPEFHGSNVYPTCPGNLAIELTAEQAAACQAK